MLIDPDQSGPILRPTSKSVASWISWGRPIYEDELDVIGIKEADYGIAGFYGYTVAELFEAMRPWAWSHWPSRASSSPAKATTCSSV